MTHLLRLLGASLAILVMGVPLLGLLLASVLDLGASAPVRASVVHWGLTLSDPLIAACLWNSVAITVVVVTLGTLSGVALARLSRTFPGRWQAVPTTLIRLGAGGHPFLLAFGWLLLVDALGRSGRSLPGLSPVLDDSGRWLLLGLSQFGFASAWVAWWTSRAFDRIGPEWLRVASLSGARGGWVWRTAVWPLVRPTVARASASLFAVLLIEPGGPILLGLRHTLGHQIVGSLWMTSRLDLARGATLAVLTVVIAGAVRGVLTRWGGPDLLTPEPPGRPDPPATMLPPSRLRSIALALLVIAWALVFLAPAAAIAAECLRAVRSDAISRTLAIAWTSAAPVLGPALALGVVSSALALVLAWPLSAFEATRSAPAVLNAVPPLALGVALFGLGQIVWQGTASARGLEHLAPVAAWLSPYRTPWLLVSWASALAHLGWAVEAARWSRSINASAFQDQARIAGRRLAFSRTLLLLPVGLRRCVVPAIGIALLAASGLAPAIVLTPLEPFRPLGAWIIRNPLGGPSPVGLVALSLASQTLGAFLLLRRGRSPESVAVFRT